MCIISIRNLHDAKYYLRLSYLEYIWQIWTDPQGRVVNTRHNVLLCRTHDIPWTLARMTNNNHITTKRIIEKYNLQRNLQVFLRMGLFHWRWVSKSSWNGLAPHNCQTILEAEIKTISLFNYVYTWPCSILLYKKCVKHFLYLQP